MSIWQTAVAGTTITAGMQAHYLGVTHLEHDPIPAGVDRPNTV